MKLKEKIEKTENKEEAMQIPEEASLILYDKDLDKVAGGFGIDHPEDAVEAWHPGNRSQINQLIDELGLKCPPVE